MSRSGREAADGFARNVFAAFDHAIFPYAFVWGWLAFAVLGPVALAVLDVALPGRVPVDTGLLAATIALSLAHWTFAYTPPALPPDVRRVPR